MLDLSRLAARQNADGGWGYQIGSSWTEPTVFAMLALAASGEVDSPAVRRGMKWIEGTQRPDGGWAPRVSVQESTWVTALVLLLPDRVQSSIHREAAVEWLLHRTGRESSWVQRWRAFLTTGHPPGNDPMGWPWISDTVAWVIPTCFGLLALEKCNRIHPSEQIRERCQSARDFLLARRCRDGGWNHGSTKALGYDSGSYPETTGLALLALHAVNPNPLTQSIETARRYLDTTMSREAEGWLRLG